jgi:hypothetical protein
MERSGVKMCPEYCLGIIRDGIHAEGEGCRGKVLTERMAMPGIG